MGEAEADEAVVPLALPAAPGLAVRVEEMVTLSHLHRVAVGVGAVERPDVHGDGVFRCPLHPELAFLELVGAGGAHRTEHLSVVYEELAAVPGVIQAAIGERLPRPRVAPGPVRLLVPAGVARAGAVDDVRTRDGDGLAGVRGERDVAGDGARAAATRPGADVLPVRAGADDDGVAGMEQVGPRGPGDGLPGAGLGAGVGVVPAALVHPVQLARAA